MGTTQVILNGKEVKPFSGAAPNGIRKVIENTLPDLMLPHAGSRLDLGKKTASMFGRLKLEGENSSFLGVTLLKKDGILNIKVNGHPDVEQFLKSFVENYGHPDVEQALKIFVENYKNGNEKSV